MEFLSRSRARDIEEPLALRRLARIAQPFHPLVEFLRGLAPAGDRCQHAVCGQLVVPFNLIPDEQSAGRCACTPPQARQQHDVPLQPLRPVDGHEFDRARGRSGLRI